MGFDYDLGLRGDDWWRILFNLRETFRSQRMPACDTAACPKTGFRLSFFALPVDLGSRGRIFAFPLGVQVFGAKYACRDKCSVPWRDESGS
jgi:hypothetical protein